VEDRISELENEMEIKGKTEALLVKQLKSCERNMQELTNSMKEQTSESQALKEKRCKQEGFIIYPTK
jgi:septal ring factor EnvC (AmiA/AmiB activator)